MLTTNSIKQFSVEATPDSSVIVHGGIAQFGSVLVPFTGASTTFTSMTTLGDGTSGWQNTLLYLSRPDATAFGVDMTRSVSAVALSQQATAYPAMADPSGFPLGLFVFHSDGTTTELMEINGI